MKEKDKNQNPEKQKPKNGRVEEAILANLLEALENGGWNEKLLHQTIEKILANKSKK